MDPIFDRKLKSLMKIPMLLKIGVLSLLTFDAFSQGNEPLPNTQPLTWNGDIASMLIDSCDAFLLKEIDLSIDRRKKYWNRDFSSITAYEKSIEENRKHLCEIIGVKEKRQPFTGPDILKKVAESSAYTVKEVRWPVFGQVHSEGLLVSPSNSKKSGAVIVVPDADQTPEELMGISGNLPLEKQTARVFAEKGYMVLIPAVIDRKTLHKRISNREFIYRSAFELGRHIIGYEVQKILAGIDWITNMGIQEIAVSGWGEGGLLAFYAGAIDTRIDETTVGGYFGSRQNVWMEPAYRNVFGLLEQFGDAEIASLIAPRKLIISSGNDAPTLVVPPGEEGKPGRLKTLETGEVEEEINRLNSMMSGLNWKVSMMKPGKPNLSKIEIFELPDSKSRHDRLMTELDNHNQWLLRESPYTRKDFMSNLRTESLEVFQESSKPYKVYFEEEIIGKFDYPLLAPDAKSRKIDIGNDKVTAYEVVLNVFENIFAYGILVIPKNLKPGEKRPVVVCQHGLEGRPQSTIGEPGFQYYKAFTTDLAERGYITFAPQNIYIFKDRFRSLQFKSNAIKKTLFSIMVPQHQQITNWLGSLDMVDKERIAFYGLSYGGKTAMRVPPLVDNYCLSICSADFNDWVWKNADSRSPYSYVWTNEYEIFEWNLGSTYNYAEMAALIAPRPFMVERGHFDGVAPDERVAYEYAKVRHLYNALLKIGDKTEIEWFDGPHSINGKGTYEFLDKHLKFESRSTN
ncbi:MAG: dienelactone hydrolase family protein [Bacteroidetes bacterium]|nr:dienelactone hydrolase family protein [Bacteroidota bacterium]MDA1121679.1 dienelactone hydrolase family protein [Bacteroidota bacterium]